MYEYVVILLVVLLMFAMSSSEYMSNRLSNTSDKRLFTSGASMRLLAQDFSGTNQGSRNTVYNTAVL